MRDIADGNELWRFATAAGGAVCAGAILLAELPPAGGLLGFAIFTGVVGFAARERPPRRLGVANRLTLVRLAALAARAGCGLAATRSSGAALLLAGWMPCLVYAAAALGDYADGAIARRTGATSAFGARLDAEADALGLAAASSIAVLSRGVLPGWYLLAGFGRYLFGAALLVEAARGRRLAPLPPSPFRRRLAGFQMGLVAVSLVPGIEPRWGLPAALTLGLPFLIGFARDYLVRTRRIRPEGGRLERGAGRRRWVPALAAAAAGLLGVLTLAGFPAGPWTLAAFCFAWLVLPGRRKRR